MAPTGTSAPATPVTRHGMASVLAARGPLLERHGPRTT
jgi:hypothetical protein